ncbi:DUF1178 family protein [Comamonas composti]|uniref:DUF1178 family protein n=1 Tax=Comamonas composti TaxID=408558 RepID=UPI00041AF20D|nr:DUF1178 family protein [Comamonas composti]
MKVLDLHCLQQHVFEGWFASEDDFQSQLSRSLVQCPVCGDTSITKRLSAPRLNLGARPEPGPAPQASASAPAGQGPAKAEIEALPAQSRERLQALQASWLRWSREVARQSEDVGERFAEEARRMHYGEIDERSIRGQATAEQAMELLDEGIAVMPLALPESSSETLQ